jgi:zinc transport system ATP-binding protein
MQVDHTKNIIEVEDINFSYGKEAVLKNINLQIHKGDYLGIVGPNGAGKTTLIKIMLGLLKPNRGSVILSTNRIGYVPQKATNFDENFPATVKEVASMGRYSKVGLLKRLNAEDKRIVEKCIEQVGMSDFKDRLIGDLSGGQQQKVFIARALASEPEVIFLDEPTTGVDQKSQEDFYTILKKLNRELDLTLVLVSHDIEKVLNEAMHIACVDHTLVCHSSPNEYLKSISESEILGKDIKILPHHHKN